MAKTGVIHGINGPVVSLLGDPGFQMNEMVYVGAENLVGEVIGLTSGKTTVQVYEETSGIRPGETVTGTGAPVSVTLAPGILSNIFDGIERPLSEIAKGSALEGEPNVFRLYLKNRSGSMSVLEQDVTIKARGGHGDVLLFT